MGSDMRLDSLPRQEQEMAPLDLASATAPDREDARHWTGALPFLVVLLLLLLSPVVYDLCRWLRTR